MAPGGRPDPGTAVHSIAALRSNPAQSDRIVPRRGAKPHEVTHEYCETMGVVPTIIPPGKGLQANGRLKYTVDWLDHGVLGGGQGSYLYRALDLFRTPTHHMGLGMGGRVAGKVNINTIFTQEVFAAVCDAMAAKTVNRFDQNDVLAAWNTLIADPLNGRTPQLGSGQITANDKPLHGLTVPIVDQSGQPLDRYRTIVRPGWPGRRLLWTDNDPNTRTSEKYSAGPSTAGGHAGAIEKYEMLSKVYNQFTTPEQLLRGLHDSRLFRGSQSRSLQRVESAHLGQGTGNGRGDPDATQVLLDHRSNESDHRSTNSIGCSGSNVAPIKQGQAPVYFSYQPNTPQPQPANQYAVSGTEDPLPIAGQPVQVKIPASGVDASGRAMGYYDGTLWSIQPGVSQVVLDVGDRQEGPFVVSAAAYDATTGSAVLAIGGGAFPVPTGIHSRGSIIRLINPDWTQPASTPATPTAAGLQL